MGAIRVRFFIRGEISFGFSFETRALRHPSEHFEQFGCLALAVSCNLLFDEFSFCKFLVFGRSSITCSQFSFGGSTSHML